MLGFLRRPCAVAAVSVFAGCNSCSDSVDSIERVVDGGAGPGGGDTGGLPNGGHAAGGPVGGDPGTTGGGGGHDVTLCEPDAQLPCYDGPNGTAGVGICVTGAKTCASDGLSYGPCEGQVLPTGETCTTELDDDCDGESNEIEEGSDCECEPGDVQDCYSGPVNTEGVGICASGLHTCGDDGTFGDCVGEVIPATESCDVDGDEDCDGTANEEGSGCLCTPGSTVACYSGTDLTLGVGACKAGVRTCVAQGTSYGACVGEVLPVPETCATSEDDDCDGNPNEEGLGCVCTPNAVEACYTGPSGTEGVGICATGTWTCSGAGTAFSECLGSVVPAMEDCGSLDDEDCDGSGCTGTFGWSSGHGSGSADIAYAVASDSEGGALVTGAFQANIDFGGGALVNAGATDVFVTKFGPSGVHQWSTRFGDSVAQTGYGIAVDSADHAIVVGEFAGSITFGGTLLVDHGAGDAFVSQLDDSGNVQWALGFGNTTVQTAYAVAVGPSDEVVVVGTSEGNVDFGTGIQLGGGDLDVFVVKLDSAGAVAWGKVFGAAGDQIAYGVAVDAAGGIAVTGTFAGSLDFGGGAHTPTAGDDAFVAKLDASGGWVWSKTLSGSGNQQGRDVAIDSAGRVTVIGDFSSSINAGLGALSSAGGSDVFLAQFNAAGDPTWAKVYGSASNQYGYGIAVDSLDQLGVTGQFAGTISFAGATLSSAGSADVFVAKIAPDGSGYWNRGFGSTSNQIGRAISMDPLGHALVTGTFNNVVDFGGGTLSSLGSTDVFVTKIGP